MKKIELVMMMVIACISVYSQQKLPEFSSSSLITQSTGYNFFVGKDSKKFQTTPQAFGSGLYDFSSTISIYNFWISRPIKRNIGLLSTIAFDLTKYRFTNNLVFDVQKPDIYVDTNNSHLYKHTFFSRQGSKLVIGRLYIPLLLYLPVSHWFKKGNEAIGLFAGIIYRPYLFSYFKRFYKQDNQLVKNKVPNGEINKFFNKNDISFKAGIKLWNLVISGQYSYYPLFNKTMSYDIHEAKIGLSFIMNYKKLNKIKNNIDDNDYGTDAK
jgi:hypothetical protein